MALKWRAALRSRQETEAYPADRLHHPPRLSPHRPSGKQTVITNRVHWAKFYLTKAGLIEVVKRGVFRATESGRATSPDERIDSALEEIEAGLRDDLLDRLFSIEPQSARALFFEKLVIRLLVAMGYGRGLGQSAMHLGGRGDGGVDGVVHLDALGLDRVYIQAKFFR